MTGFTVMRPGIFSSLQDLGRQGYHSLGITSGGAMDRHAYSWANQLCGNSQSAICIEILVGGLELQAEIATQIAITGAEVPVSINGQAVATWCNHRVQAGDRITLGYANGGCRAYLAVAGGIEAPLIFGSASTVVRECLGGLNGDGKPLQRGDTLPCQASSGTVQQSTPQQYITQFTDKVTEVRMVLGYQHHQFSASQLALFFASVYSISQNSDRMGYRLEGPAIVPPQTAMLSEGICLGAVQLPADGQPIILLNDRQTIGGYPKLGSVLSVDINKLAQLMPGKKLRFVPMDIKQASSIVSNSGRIATGP
jgi:biotin-dependent carboxylase-like uncharacterized protein